MAKNTDNTVPAVVPFLFEGDTLVRVEMRNGDPWFVVADICRILRIGNPTKAVLPLDEDEKGLSSIQGKHGNERMNIVSEGGFYSLALRCRDAMKAGTDAHRLRKWVTAEVLPAIRKTGGYRAQPRQGLSAEERAERSALAARRMRVNEMHAATRALEALRHASGSRAAALAAPQIYAALGINTDPDASDTLAQGELSLSVIH